MVWLLGGKGMLGCQISLELQKREIPFWSTDIEVDITSLEQLRGYASGKKIRWVINSAAYTAVDRAESETEKAFAINADGAGNIARVAEEAAAKLIHFSTDYVFNGRQPRPYTEEDPADPVSAYGKSKWEGEQSVRKQSRNCFLIRISWLYGIYGPNFVKTMLRLLGTRPEVRVVKDQVGSPTYAAALARNILDRLIISDSDRFGLYHYSDSGEISWYDFACAIRETAIRRGVLNQPPEIKAISTAEFPTAAIRPPYSLLDKSRIVRELGFQVFPWRENLQDYFSEGERLNRLI